MRLKRMKSIVITMIMLLMLVLNPVCMTASAAEASDEFHKGGSISLSASGAGSAEHIYIYRGTSGNFVWNDEEANDVSYESDDKSILSVGSAGKYKAKSEGIAALTVTVSDDEDDDQEIEFQVHVVEYPKNLNVSPKKKVETKPTQDAGSVLQTKFKITGAKITEGTKVDVTVTEGSMRPSVSRNGNEVTLTATSGGECTVTVEVNGAETEFKWTLNGISAEPCLLAEGKNTMVSVLHAKPNDFKWTSADKRIAVVTSQGKVTAKRTGNVILTGVHRKEGYKVGCVVSVTTEKKYKAIETGKELGKGVYSQAKRMQNGYYDCSSLVWRAYAPVGYNFGVPSGYAPTAASEASYLEKEGKLYGTWDSKYMTKMKYQAGDLMFRTNTGNGRYRGINHVEMITGYTVIKFSKNGKATVACTWAARNPEYSFTIYDHDIVSKV